MNNVHKIRQYRGVGIYLTDNAYYKIRNNLNFVKYYSVDFITEEEIEELIDSILN